MLNKEEEEKLVIIMQQLEEDINQHCIVAKMDVKIVAWLAAKLKETNDELKKFKEEVNRVVDEEWKKHWERNP